jgi:peptide/nickel transport system permease protein
VFVVIGVTTVVFFLIRLSGDPAILFLPPEASSEQIASLRREYELDQPLPVQYARYLQRVAQGDFGRSFGFGQPAMPLVLSRMGATLTLAVSGLGFAVLLGVPLAIVAALRRGTWLDTALVSAAVTLQNIPTFWLGLMLIGVFAVSLRLLPSSGYGEFKFLVLPAVTLGAYSLAVVVRLLRSSLLEVFAENYLRTARAKGLTERVIVLRHALKNAALPVVTVIGIQFGALFGGAVVTEYVFAYPGMGRLALQAVSNRDFAVVQAFVFVVAAMITATNLLVDMSYRFFDPRVRV